jgi:hypothetical protein
LFGTFVYGDAAPEIWQLIPPTAIMIVGGTIAALATLDLEPISAFFHYAFYLVITVLLRVAIGLAPLGGGAGPTETTAATAMSAWASQIVPSADSPWRARPTLRAHDWISIEPSIAPERPEYVGHADRAFGRLAVASSAHPTRRRMAGG